MTRHTLPVAVALAAVLGAAGLEPTLKSETLAGWTAYVAATERRVERELGAGAGFLAQDFGPAAAADRQAVLANGIVVRHAETTNAQGREIDVPSAMVHHWRGAVLIRGMTVANLLAQLQTSAPPTRQEDVLQSAVLDRGPDRMKVYLKVQRSKFVTVVYNTEHIVTFRRHGATRASSASTATKIAELESPNTPQERELRAGQDRGFLWRWNAYWRYEQVDAGVIAECESISLSRGIPSVLKYLVSPLISSTARESMERTLGALRLRFEKK